MFPATRLANGTANHGMTAVVVDDSGRLRPKTQLGKLSWADITPQQSGLISENSGIRGKAQWYHHVWNAAKKVVHHLRKIGRHIRDRFKNKVGDWRRRVKSLRNALKRKVSYWKNKVKRLKKAQMEKAQRFKDEARKVMEEKVVAKLERSKSKLSNVVQAAKKAQKDEGKTLHTLAIADRKGLMS